MWMMGYNIDGGDFNNIPDSFNGRKLRPLIPRPLPSPNTTSTTTPPPPPCLARIHHGNDFFSQYHHLGVAEQSKRDHQLNTPQVVVSSRWNPTPEQLRALEELYRRGTRTPSADQIQHITTQLRKYGKIEGKNVFYWFQNHKARERQKRRRQMESAIASAADDLQILSSENKKDQLGASRTVFEVEQTKNWAPSTNCSTLAEESAVSILQRTAKAAAADHCRTDGWIQFDEEELQQTRNFVERNATWQMMQLSCPSPPTAAPTHHLINSTPITTSCTTCTTTTTTSRATVTTMDQKHLIKSLTHHNDLSIFIAPYRSVESCLLINHQNQNTNGFQDQEESQTLQLFPLRSGDYGHESNVHHEKETQLSAGSAMSASFSTTPNYPFFEFLPLKN